MRCLFSIVKKSRTFDDNRAPTHRDDMIARDDGVFNLKGER